MAHRKKAVSKFAAVLLVCLGGITRVQAQADYSIRGAVADTSSSLTLVKAAVSVIRAKDSILVDFAWTSANGAFGIGHLPQGDFILLTSYPGYADYTEHFSLGPSSPTRDFGRLNLSTKAKVLAEVILRGRAAIVIKGDTTNFNAENFTIQPHSKVEDLLKQLPGIEVDKEGRITAQGQSVTKVLLDGEEFFGDDPTLITRNIRGDMVDKIQLYDKKSDQAAFTGIPDDKKIKTLNVVLKEDSKRGYFGKADAGKATESYYQGQAMVNLFGDTQKFAAYGTLANTGKIGLAFDDASKAGVTAFISSGVWSGSIDELEPYNGRYDGRGIPLARTAGTHYDTKFDHKKNALNVNYRIGSINVDGDADQLKQNFLPLEVLTFRSDQTNTNYLFRQKLDATYDMRLDSTATLKITADGLFRNSETTLNENGSSLRGDQSLQYRNKRRFFNDADQQTFNTSLYWAKKLRKPRRTLSVRAVQSFNNERRNGQLNNSTDFFNSSGSKDSTQTVDQHKTVESDGIASAVTATWSEPVTRFWSAILSYGLNVNNSQLTRRSANRSDSGNYDQTDPLFTNDLDYKQLTHNGALYFSYRKGQSGIDVDAQLVQTNYRQNDAFTGQRYERSFFNVAPEVRLSHSGPQKSYGLSYSGRSTQPRIDQLQPLNVNDDPLNITVGNPNLGPSYTNNVGVFYSFNKVLKGLTFSMNSSFGLISNSFATTIVNDAAGKRSLSWVNLAGKPANTYQVNASLNKKFKASNIQTGLNVNTYSRTDFSYQNAVLNKLERNTYNLRFSASRYVQSKNSISVSIGPGYAANAQSLRPGLDDNRWSLNASGSFTLYLPGKTEISSDASYAYQQQSQSFYRNINPLIINTSFSKKFFQSQGLKLSVSGNDVLNQNVGLSQSAFGQTAYTTIQRYFMGSLTWDFSKMGPVKK